MSNLSAAAESHSGVIHQNTFTFRKDVFWMGVAILTLSTCLIVLGLLFTSRPASYGVERNHRVASQQTELSLNKVNSLIGSASHNNISVRDVFKGPGQLTGAVMQSKNGEGIAWITPDGKNIFVGTLMDAQGNNLSKLAFETHIRHFQEGGQLSDILQKLPAVSLGDTSSSKTLYVFGDVNCHYCEDLFREIGGFDGLGAAVQWIPVAILGDKSLNQAATLLSLGNNEDRLALLKHHHGALHESIREMSREDLNYQALTSQIKKSTQVLERLGQGTPLLAYVNQKGSIDIFPKKPTREELRQIISKIR